MYTALVLAGLVSGILLGALSNWVYDLLRSHNYLPDRPTFKRGIVVALASLPLLAVAVVPALIDTSRSERQPGLTLDDLKALTPSPSSVGASTVGGYGPSRPILDWSNEADRVGFTDGPHFNSYINTNVYGDERGFLDAKPTLMQEPGGFKDQISNARGRYYVRAYIENGGLLGQDRLSTMTARNSRIQFEWKPGSANGVSIQARITADNAIPSKIYDVVSFDNDSQRFSISLIHGSARIYNRHYPNGLKLGDEIVTSGVLLGSAQMDGRFLPGYEESAFVVIEVVAG